MRSLFQSKYWILTLAIIALVALTVLAVGLRNVSFNEAQPLYREEAEVTTVPRVSVSEVIEEIPIQSQVVFWGVAALLAILIGLLLTPEGRRALLRIFWRAFVTYWMLYLVFKYYGAELASLLDFNFQSRGSGAVSSPTDNAAPPVFTPPQPSSLMTYVASTLVILLVVFIAWRISAFLRQFMTGQPDKEPLKEIAKIAHASLRDLSDGGDSTDVIMNCYFRMSHVVADKHRLQRVDSMTPAEFAFKLEQSGLPGDAVQRLTRLFEAVRYGGKRSGPRDTNEAVACLTSILEFCGEAV